MLPQQLVDQLADPAVDKTCFVAALGGKASGIQYLLLTMQIADVQVAVIAPLASQLVQQWFSQALNADSNSGFFRFLLTAAEGEVVTAVGLPYVVDAQGTTELRTVMSAALNGTESPSPVQQRDDYRRAIKLVEMQGNDVSLVEGIATRERHVLVLRPRDWPKGDSLDDAEGLSDVLH